MIDLSFLNHHTHTVGNELVLMLLRAGLQLFEIDRRIGTGALPQAAQAETAFQQALDDIGEEMVEFAHKCAFR